MWGQAFSLPPPFQAASGIEGNACIICVIVMPARRAEARRQPRMAGPTWFSHRLSQSRLCNCLGSLRFPQPVIRRSYTLRTGHGEWRMIP
jgi:hypothetical protein